MKKISKFLPIFALVLSFTLLLYTFYRAQIHFSGQLNYYYIPYYITFSIFLVLSVISFFINDDLKIKTLIVTISAVFGLYVVESFLHLKERSRDNFRIKTYKENVGKDYETRNRFDFFKDLREKYPDVVLNIPPNHYPGKYILNAISNRKTILCNENGYYAVYQSDRYGFNNPDEEWDKEIDFLILGDSFGLGACVNYPNTFQGNLKKLSNQKGVLSISQVNYGELSKYVTLKEYFPEKKVKRILWFFYEENDLQELREELNYANLSDYLKNKDFFQNLKSKQNEIDEILINRLNEEVDKEETTKSYLFDHIKLFQVRLKLKEFYNFLLKGRKYYELETSDYENFEKILKLSYEFSKDKDVKFYFVYLPEFGRYVLKYDERYKKKHEQIIRIVSSLNIPIIDLHKELFQRHNPLLFFPFKQYGHYNETGFKMASELIFEKIRKFENKN